MQINHAACKHPVCVHPDLFELTSWEKHSPARTVISILPWDPDSNLANWLCRCKVPSPKEIKQALSLTDPECNELDAIALQYFSDSGRHEIDLGALAALYCG